MNSNQLSQITSKETQLLVFNKS